MENITVKMFQRRNDVCREGVEIFKELFPDGAKLTLTNLKKAVRRHDEARRYVSLFLTRENREIYFDQRSKSKQKFEREDRKLGDYYAKMRKEPEYKELEVELRQAQKVMNQARRDYNKARDSLSNFEHKFSSKWSKIRSKLRMDCFRETDVLLIKLLKEQRAANYQD